MCIAWLGGGGVTPGVCMAFACWLIADALGNHKGGHASLHSMVWGQHCLGTALFEADIVGDCIQVDC